MPNGKINYFAYGTAAKRYARARPYFHSLVTSKIKDFLKLKEPLDTALDTVLDVGCGTGLSTLSLKEIAVRIVGMDISAEMLSEASNDPAITYLVSPAEEIRLTSASFDLLTVSSAFHWLDRDKFMAEAHRLLRLNKWLIIYDNYFFSRMKENPEYEKWHRNSYVLRYPIPPRNNEILAEAHTLRHGFRFVHKEEYTNDVSFSAEQLASYLMTQSNIIAAVESGTGNPDHVYTWLIESLRPMLQSDKASF